MTHDALSQSYLFMSESGSTLFIPGGFGNIGSILEDKMEKKRITKIYFNKIKYNIYIYLSNSSRQAVVYAHYITAKGRGLTRTTPLVTTILPVVYAHYITAKNQSDCLI